MSGSCAGSVAVTGSPMSVPAPLFSGTLRVSSLDGNAGAWLAVCDCAPQKRLNSSHPTHRAIPTVPTKPSQHTP